MERPPWRHERQRSTEELTADSLQLTAAAGRGRRSFIRHSTFALSSSTIPGSRSKRCRERAIQGSGAAFRGPGNDSPGAGWGLGRSTVGRACRRVRERDIQGVSSVEGQVVAAGVAGRAGPVVSRTESPEADGRDSRMAVRKVTRRVCRRESWRESEGESETDSEVASRRARPRTDFRLQIDDCRWQSAETEGQTANSWRLTAPE